MMKIVAANKFPNIITFHEFRNANWAEYFCV